MSGSRAQIVLLVSAVASVPSICGEEGVPKARALPESRQICEQIHLRGAEAIPQTIDAILAWQGRRSGTYSAVRSLVSRGFAQPFARAVADRLAATERLPADSADRLGADGIAALMRAVLFAHRQVERGVLSRLPTPSSGLLASVDGETALLLLEVACAGPVNIRACDQALKMVTHPGWFDRDTGKANVAYCAVWVYAIRQLEQAAPIGMKVIHKGFVHSKHVRTRYPLRAQLEALAALRTGGPEGAEELDKLMQREASSDAAIAELLQIAVEADSIRVRVEALGLLGRLGRGQQAEASLRQRLASKEEGPDGAERARIRFTLRLLVGLGA